MESVADVEGPWVEPRFDSTLIGRIKQSWNTPVSRLSNSMLATFLRQRIGPHTLRLVRSWLSRQQFDVNATEAWLHANGGHCDCEALANAEQAWRDAIHDANWD